jgi:hypothetical protein
MVIKRSIMSILDPAPELFFPTPRIISGGLGLGVGEDAHLREEFLA